MKLGKKSKVQRELTRKDIERRNSLKRITISSIVAFLLFLALTVIQGSILNQEEKQTVYQVIKDIQEGTKFTEDNVNKYVEEKKVQLSLIPENPIKSVDDLIGKYADRDYKAKDVITKDGVTDKHTDYTAGIKNPVEVSFMLDSLESSIAGKLREGDYITIYCIDKNGEEPTIVYEHIFLEKVYDSSGVRLEDTTDEESQALLFTVIVEEETAEEFYTNMNNRIVKVVKILYNVGNQTESTPENDETEDETKDEVDNSSDYLPEVPEVDMMNPVVPEASETPETQVPETSEVQQPVTE